MLRVLIVVCIIGMIACLKMIDVSHEARIEMIDYCNMVELRKIDGVLGWPDYKGIYDKECK